MKVLPICRLRVPLVSTTEWVGEQIPQAWALASVSIVPLRLTFSWAAALEITNRVQIRPNEYIFREVMFL
jgi:hypothetical protein